MSKVYKNKNLKSGDLVRDKEDRHFEVHGYGIFIKYINDPDLRYDDRCIVCWSKTGCKVWYDEFFMTMD